jgi:polyribonucleotide nucleotidyltransferase
VVLDLNKETNQISLGMKQLEPDAWETYFSNHNVGETVSGLVVRLAKFGVFVELERGIEGLCHSSQIPAAPDAAPIWKGPPLSVRDHQDRRVGSPDRPALRQSRADQLGGEMPPRGLAAAGGIRATMLLDNDLARLPTS